MIRMKMPFTGGCVCGDSLRFARLTDHNCKCTAVTRGSSREPPRKLRYYEFGLLDKTKARSKRKRFWIDSVKSCIAKESLGSACANTWHNWIKEAETPASTISFLSRQSVKFLGSKSFHLLIQRRAAVTPLLSVTHATTG